MSMTCLRETTWRHLDCEQLCQGALTNTIPVLAHILLMWDILKGRPGPSSGGTLPRREPNKFCTFCFLPHFEITFPLASQKLTEHFRKIKVNSKLNQKSRGLPVSLALCGKKEAGKAFDVSVVVEEEVYSVLAQSRCSGNICPQPIPRQESGLPHILTNVCLWSHTVSATVTFVCYV